MSLVLRSAKLDPLTHTELDGNFEFLDDKIADMNTLLNGYVEVPSGVSVGDTIYWDGTEWAVTSTLNADTVTNGVYTTGNQTIGGVKTFTSTINGSITGTAPTLQTPRKINGTNFNGSTNIETAYWGPGRHISIGGTTKVVNGSANVTWSSGDIHAGSAGSASVASRTVGTLTINGTPYDGSSNLSISTSGYNGSDAVKLTGNQTIAGVKTFSNTIVGNITNANVASVANSTASSLTINGTSFNGSSDVTMTISDANAVTLDTTQSITGAKTFTRAVYAPDFLIGGGATQGTIGVASGGRILCYPNQIVVAQSGGAAMYVSSAIAASGSMTVTGNITAYYSDERMKEKTGDITDALDKIDQIDTFLYKNNDVAKGFGYTTDEEQVGVSAQSVKKVLPQVVSLAPFDRDEDGKSKSGEDYQTVDYARLSALLITALKEAKERIEILESKVD